MHAPLGLNTRKKTWNKCVINWLFNVTVFLNEICYVNQYIRTSRPDDEKID